jgi:hypothetical protein
MSELNGMWRASTKIIDEKNAEIGRLHDLLRQVRAEVEWWTPDETCASEMEGERLPKWYALRDRIDAALENTGE